MRAWLPVPLCLVFCGVAAAQTSVADLVRNLSSTDNNTRIQAYRELRRRRAPESIALLADRLPQFPAGGQSYGMYLLQQFPLDATRAAYRRLLETGGPFLRAASAATLYRGGDRSVIPVLTAAIAAADDQERRSVLGRIYGIDDLRVTTAVRALIRTGARYDGINNAFWHLLLAEKGRSQATIDAATALLADAGTDARSRAVAAAYLLAAGETGHSSALATALEDEPSMLTSIKRYLDRAPRVGHEVLDVLVETLAAASNQVEVTYPAQILQKHAPGRAVPILQTLLGSDRKLVRKATLTALSTIPGALQPKILHGMLASDDPEQVLAAANILRRMDDAAGLARVLDLARAGGVHKAEAIQVLGHFRVRTAVPPLLDALADSDLTVRRNALAGLVRILPGLFPYRRFDLQSSGYRPDGPPEQRAAGLLVLRAWWHAVQ